MNFILFLQFILLKILIFDFVNSVKENGKNIQRKKHVTKIHKVKDDYVYKIRDDEREGYMKQHNISEGPAIDLLTQLKHMKEKGVKNFNEIPSNTQVYDAVSPPQNSGLYSSPASSNNPQQNLSNPPNQFTYNLSHINHPSHQQGSSGFINTALLNTIDANEHQKSLKSKSDISGFETQFKGKYLGNKWENKWDAKLKALNDSEDERKKAIEKYSQYIGNVHDTLLGNDNYNDNVFNNPHLDKMQKSLENVVSGSSQHQTPPAQNFNKNHEHASEIDADDYVDLGSNSEN